jgi:hypothetical protein
VLFSSSLGEPTPELSKPPPLLSPSSGRLSHHLSFEGYSIYISTKQKMAKKKERTMVATSSKVTLSASGCQSGPP